MENSLAERLARVADYQTATLVHHGRKSGNPYEVTIWFMVEGDTVYLATTNVGRQWTRNVFKRPDVSLRIGSETFSGAVEAITDEAGRAHTMEMVSSKYWYARPYLWIAQMLAGAGLIADRTGAFLVRLDATAT